MVTFKILLIFFEFFFTKANGFNSQSNCQPFKIYRNLKISPNYNSSLLNELKKENFFKKKLMLEEILGFNDYKTLSGKVNLKSKIDCILSFLLLDKDSDGIKDWQLPKPINSSLQFVPLDQDWDNDGDENIIDENPFLKNNNRSTFKNKIKTVPRHLKISRNSNDVKNKLQLKILQKCNVLAVNYTDIHSVKILHLFHNNCSKYPISKKRSQILILYAFKTYGLVARNLATYHPEINSLSIPGKSSENIINLFKFENVLRHEIGHYLVFNFFSPNQLKKIATRFGKWTVKNEVNSFYDPSFFEKSSNSHIGYYPTNYSNSNIHEWMSEVISIYLNQKKYSQLKTPVALADLLDELIKKNNS